MGSTSRKMLIDEDVLINLANRAGISLESLIQSSLAPIPSNTPSEYIVPDDSFGPQIDMSSARNMVPSGIFG
ncbi:MAG: hypothetical protein ABIL44_01130 [candidate division WOR-3 bacterium]